MALETQTDARGAKQKASVCCESKLSTVKFKLVLPNISLIFAHAIKSYTKNQRVAVVVEIGNLTYEKIINE